MRKSYIVFLATLLSLSSFGQTPLNWEFKTVKVNGKSYAVAPISQTLPNGKPTRIIFLENDSIKLSAVFNCTNNSNKVKKLKVRYEVWQNGKWKKPPLKIDRHGGRRFRINRCHTWMRTSWGWNAGKPPMNVWSQCMETLHKQELYIDTRIVLN